MTAIWAAVPVSGDFDMKAGRGDGAGTLPATGDDTGVKTVAGEPETFK